MSKNIEININTESGYEVLYPKTLFDLVDGNKDYIDNEISKVNTTINGIIGWKKIMILDVGGKSVENNGTTSVYPFISKSTIFSDTEDVLITVETDINIKATGIRSGYGGFFNFAIYSDSMQQPTDGIQSYKVSVSYNETQQITVPRGHYAIFIKVGPNSYISNYFYGASSYSPLNNIYISSQLCIGGIISYCKAQTTSGSVAIYKRQSLYNFT